MQISNGIGQEFRRKAWPEKIEIA